jgi:hypothetical protein
MTVCVATISYGTVFGASDRMITSGDIEFEPGRMRKAFWFTKSIVAMWAGEAAYQAEVLEAVHRRVAARSTEANDWSVREVADLYVEEWLAAKRRRAEQQILAPVGLTADGLLSGKHGLRDTVVTRLIESMIEYELPGEREGITATIITGIDRDHPNNEVGAHLYRVWNGHASCEDAIGFAAIGAGSWHANSQLMLAGYHRLAVFEEALWLTYLAKRRAEVAPGVGGRGTDVFMLSGGGGRTDLVDQTVHELDVRYDKVQLSEATARAEQIASVKSWLEELKTQNAARNQQAQAAASAPEAPSSPTSSASVQT